MNFVETSNFIFKNAVLDYHKTNDINSPITNPYVEGTIEHELYHKNWIDVDEYRDFMLEAAHMLDAENRNVKTLYPKTVAQLKFIADRIADEKVRNTLLHQLAATYVERHGTDDIQDLENIYLTYEHASQYL